MAICAALGLSACTAVDHGRASPRTSTSSAHVAAPATPLEPLPPAVPKPFGLLACKPEYGVRVCAGNGTTERVPSFDGVPLDSDVTLPARGRGPFPLIVMLHGLAGSKVDFEYPDNAGPVNNVSFARDGWAVLNYTARGFGKSCGTAASRRGAPRCARGWLHLADQRYEIRDTQYLAGLLVDEGLVKPSIAVTGISYGGGQTLELAMLKNRERLTNGRLVPWVSPKYHVPMSIGAAYAEWGWDDLVTALDPNGALSTASYSKPSVDLAPAGVEKQSWDDLLYAATSLYYLSPPGVDPTADLTTWHHAIDAGEPYSSVAERYLRQLEEYHSAIGIPMPAGGPAPLVMQNGWTDTLFPVSEALHWSSRYGADHVNPPLLQIFDDVGHGWAQGKRADIALQQREAVTFLDDVMLKHARPPTGVIAIGTTCPGSAPSSPILRASSWHALLASGSMVTATGGSHAQVVTSGGGSRSVAADLNPAYHSPYCDPLPAATEPGTAHYTVVRPRSSPLVLVGPLTVRATLRVKGSYPELVARLWDVNPATHRRQLVEAGDYRPPVNQAAGTSTSSVATTVATFELEPNLWTLAPGHLLVLELVGSTAPWFRASNGRFSITVTRLTASVATR